MPGERIFDPYKQEPEKVAEVLGIKHEEKKREHEAQLIEDLMKRVELDNEQGEEHEQK